MSILVTGGAGYIGSHAVLDLCRAGYDVVVLDNLSKGHREMVKGDAKFYHGDTQDQSMLDEIFTQHKIDAIFHFAASSLVGESVVQPLLYYDNNVVSMVRLLGAMVRHEVKRIVFSSTAAVYGIPERIPVTEDDPTMPINPYGESKLAIEKMLKWCGAAHDINSVCLRYFNVAGADKSGEIGELHNPETHLIPNILKAAKHDDAVTIFGTDYDTRDGTCVRDYIHVTDLIDAHILAYDYLRNGGKPDVFNLGSGGGYSNLEILNISREITGKNIQAVMAARRAGDPATLVASSDKAKAVLGWKPAHEDLRQVIGSAWKFIKEYDAI